MTTYPVCDSSMQTIIKPLTDHHGVCDDAMLMSKHKYANVFLLLYKATQENGQKEVHFITTVTFPQLYFIHI